jgi:hypothetical protein
MRHLILSLLCSFFLFGAALGGGSRPLLVLAIVQTIFTYSISLIGVSRRTSPWNACWYLPFVGVTSTLLWNKDQSAQMYFQLISVILALSAFAGITSANRTWTASHPESLSDS